MVTDAEPKLARKLFYGLILQIVLFLVLGIAAPVILLTKELTSVEDTPVEFTGALSSLICQSSYLAITSIIELYFIFKFFSNFKRVKNQ